MKRLFYIFLLNAISIVAMAATFEIDGICYSTTSSKEVMVSSNETSNYSGNIIIPETVSYEGTTYTVTGIDDGAFRNSAITSIHLPSTLLIIYGWAFYGCTQLRSLTIPASVTYINGTFRYLNSLESIEVEAGNKHFTSIDNVIYTADLSEVVYYGETKTDETFNMPESVTYIRSWACSGCKFKNIVFSPNLKSIGGGAFSSCENLEAIDLPEGITEISSCAFRYCNNLASIKLPNSLTSIQHEGIEGSAITELVIPEKVNYIANYALNCSKLKKLQLLNPEPPEICDETFYDSHYKRLIVIVPNEGYDKYISDPAWSRFSHIEASTIFKLKVTEYSLLVGKTYELAYIQSPDLKELPIKWESSNSQVASVANGIVTGLSIGTTTITASCGTFSSTCQITIVDKPAQTVIWGYSDDDTSLGIGSGQDKAIQCAIYLPNEFIQNYKGKTITKFELGFNDPVTNLVPIIDEGDGNNQVEQAETSCNTGWNIVELENPYVIGNQPFYAGYRMPGTCAAAVSGDSDYNGFYIDDGYGWSNYSAYGWGSLCIRLHIEGFDLPVDIKMTSHDEISISKGSSASIALKFRNLSPDVVKTISLEYDFSGKNAGVKQFDLNIAKGSSETVNLNIEHPGKPGQYQLNLKAANVNGIADANPTNSTISLPFTILGKTYPRRVVCEEGTGTWCGWCIRGYVGLKQMAEKYPDDFIGIAIHSGDEMDNVENYDDIFGPLGTGFPSCIINRKITADPNFNELESCLLEAKDEAIATISAKMYVEDADTTAVLLHTETEFGVDISTPYSIAFVVVENAVGPYRQANFYSGLSTVMGGFENEASKVEILFNDVARGIYGGFNGNTVFASATNEMPYTYDYRLVLPDNIGKKSNIEIVALLINETTGEIVNAYKCKHFSDGSADGIHTSETLTPSDPVIYDLNGVRRPTMSKGIIIKDGKKYFNK